MAVTVQQAIEAAQGTRGFVTQIAARLGISRTQVYNLMKKYPTFKQAIEDEREQVKDMAESKILEKIEAGDTVMLIFYAKTQMKDRGYVERQELTGADGDALKVWLTRLTETGGDSDG